MIRILLERQQKALHTFNLESLRKLQIGGEYIRDSRGQHLEGDIFILQYILSTESKT